ncbi:MAG TPA: response regulator [Oculatellaceae cyanobacterium]|jgi:CheY-like chemotaxis protein
MSNFSVNILVVDDEPLQHDLFQQFFRKQIKSKEYNFIFALDGKAALEQIESQPEIDLIVTDLKMPEMDGFSFMKELNSLAVNKKVIVISAYASLKNMRKSMHEGVFDFLAKPVDFKELEATIQKILVQQQQEKIQEQSEEILASRKGELVGYIKPQFRKIVRDAAVLPEAVKIKLILELAEDLDAEQLESLIEDLEIQIDTAIKKEEKQKGQKINLEELYQEFCPELLPQLLAVSPTNLEDYQRGLKKKLPDVELKPGEWIEPKYIRHKLSNGETKVYGPYFVVRGQLPNGKRYNISLGKYINAPELLPKLPKYDGETNSPPASSKQLRTSSTSKKLSSEEHTATVSGSAEQVKRTELLDKPVESQVVSREQLPVAKAPIKLYGADFERKRKK